MLSVWRVPRRPCQSDVVLFLCVFLCVKSAHTVYHRLWFRASASLTQPGGRFIIRFALAFEGSGRSASGFCVLLILRALEIWKLQGLRSGSGSDETESGFDAQQLPQPKRTRRGSCAALKLILHLQNSYTTATVYWLGVWDTVTRQPQRTYGLFTLHFLFHYAHPLARLTHC